MAILFILKVVASLPLLAAAFIIVLYHWKNRKILSLARKLPNDVPFYPLIGHGYFLVHGVLGMTNKLYKIGKRVASRTIQSFVFWAGPHPIFMLYEPEDIQTLLNSEKALDIGSEVNLVRFGLGNGLLTAPAHLWKITRRHMNPLFYPRNLEALVPALNQCGMDLTATLSSLVGQGQVDVSNHVYSATLKSSVYLVFGPNVEVDMQSKSFQGVMWAFPRLTELLGIRIMKVWLWSDLVFQFLYRNDLQKIEKYIRDFLGGPLKNKEEEFPEGEFIDDRKLLDNVKGSTTQLTLPEIYRAMMRQYPNFTEKDLQYEVVTMLVAGSATTRVTVASCMLALAANPQMQERVYSEVMSVVDSKDSEVTLEDIKSMPYLEQVIKESLRKFMVAPIITRSLSADIKLSFCTVPAGASACAALFGLYFDPRHYPDPERFDPERFTPENVAQREKQTFLPFGSGIRYCIGKAFAMIMMKILLVHTIRKFRLTTSVDIDNITYKQSFSLQAADGYKIALQNRHRY